MFPNVRDYYLILYWFPSFSDTTFHCLYHNSSRPTFSSCQRNSLLRNVMEVPCLALLSSYHLAAILGHLKLGHYPILQTFHLYLPIKNNNIKTYLIVIEV